MSITSFNELQGFVRNLPSRLECYREMLIANLVMIGEIPAPTFEERQRLEFLKQRFVECDLENISTDEVGNALAVLPGSDGGNSILISSHADTPFAANVSHSITVDSEHVIGPGVADNSLGLAVLATLPTVLEGIGMRTHADLILMGAVRSLGQGNLGGLRFFLTHNTRPIVAALCLEGVHLGRLHYTSRASIGCEVTIRVSEFEESGETRRGGAIVGLNRVINELSTLVPDEDEDTTLVLGGVEGGTAYKTPARSAQLRFQVRGKSSDRLNATATNIDDMIQKLSAETGAFMDFRITAHSDSGGLTADHPLVKAAHAVTTALDIEPRMGCCSSAASSFSDHGIPALTVGITAGANLNQTDEKVAVRLMFKGLAQVVGIIKALDGGCCD